MRSLGGGELMGEALRGHTDHSLRDQLGSTSSRLARLVHRATSIHAGDELLQFVLAWLPTNNGPAWWHLYGVPSRVYSTNSQNSLAYKSSASTISSQLGSAARGTSGERFGADNMSLARIGEENGGE